MAELRLGALEAGGTKMVCAIGDENGKIYEQVSIPTTTPKETIPKMIAYFRDKGIDALGIACFGPIELDRDSEKYGYITTTPKLAWRDCDIVGQMQEALHCPVGFDTDVNGSVLGEVTFGQAQGKKCVMYLTIGTGVGGGVMHQEQLFPLIRKKLKEYINGYIVTDELADMEHYVVPASLHDDQGIMGCLELARRALENDH